MQNALLKIPVFPPVAMRLVQLLNNEEVSHLKLSEVLKADPVFSGEILSHANSALYGLPAIKNLPHAIIVIGHQRLRSLALTLATGRYLKGVLILEELRTFWRYTLACAKIAERIAVSYGVSEDQAYCAALFHDISRLGLMAAYPDKYANLIRIAKLKLSKGEEWNMSDLERSTFDLDRYQAGAVLAERWGLPQEFRAGIGGSPRQRRKSPGGWWWWCARRAGWLCRWGSAYSGTPKTSITRPCVKRFPNTPVSRCRKIPRYAPPNWRSRFDLSTQTGWRSWKRCSPSRRRPARRGNRSLQRTLRRKPPRASGQSAGGRRWCSWWPASSLQLFSSSC